MSRLILFKLRYRFFVLNFCLMYCRIRNSIYLSFIPSMTLSMALCAYFFLNIAFCVRVYVSVPYIFVKKMNWLNKRVFKHCGASADFRVASSLPKVSILYFFFLIHKIDGYKKGFVIIICLNIYRSVFIL